MTQILREALPAHQAWLGQDISKGVSWMDTLSPEERDLIAAAGDRLSPPGPSWLSLDPSDVPLPGLEVRLASMAHELQYGRGFLLIRGLDVRQPMEALKRQYWVLGTHFGEMVSQNYKGEVLTEVTDKGSRYADDIHARGYTSSDEMVFHSDAGDCVSLLCVRSAKEGGDNAIVSMAAVHNAILAERPDLLPQLYEGFRSYKREEAAGASQRHVSRRRFPVFSYFDGRLSGGINLKSVKAVPIVTGEPFEPAEQEALDYLEQVINRPEMRLRFRMQPGDLLLVNNFAVLHKRWAFVDHDDPAQKRLLLRFWMNLRVTRTLDPAVAGWMRRGFDAQPVLEAAE